VTREEQNTLPSVGPKVPCDHQRPFLFKRETRDMGVPDESSGEVVFPVAVPGTWFMDGNQVRIACPECGCEATLSQHGVASDGTVRPSMVCPRQDGGHCTAHYFGRLLDWGTR
jgi:hypothetical protein